MDTSSAPPSHRRRIRLIEILVLGLLLTVALILIIPAVLDARENARRSRCADNLRQIAMAGLVYTDAWGVLPSGSYNCATHPHNFSVFVRLLPYFDNRPTYNAINMDLAHVDPAHITVGGYAVNVLFCPSDPTAAQASAVHYSGNPNSPQYIPQGSWRQYFCSYAGNAGTWDLDINPSASNFEIRRKSMNGTIFGMSAVPLAEISDGLSSTMLFGERAHGILDVPLIASKLTTWTGPALSEYHFWQSGETVDALFETWGPPNQYKTGVGIPKYESLPYLAANAGSFHPQGGANFAFCDGSVRFLKETIPSWKLNHVNIPNSINYDDHEGVWSLRPGSRFEVYQALSTRNGSETLEGEDY